MVSAPNTLPLDATVEAVLVSGERRWNWLVIDAIFYVGEASMIKSIPLSHVAGEDSQFWSFRRLYG